MHGPCPAWAVVGVGGFTPEREPANATLNQDPQDSRTVALPMLSDLYSAV